MRPEDLWCNYPVLYHIAWGGSWPNIEANGLLSTHALLRLYEKEEEEIARLTRCRRGHWIRIECPGMPEAVLRDQKPMTDKGLEKALGGKVEPWRWYELVNSMVFFWPTKKRLKTMLSAKAYEDVSHDVLVVDTRKLVQLECSNIRLSRMNSGCTKPYPHKRDMGLFKEFSDYPFESRWLKYGKAKAVAEVCVLRGVERIEKAVREVKSGFASELIAALGA